MDEITLNRKDDYESNPIKLNLNDLDLRITHGGNYEPIKLDLEGSNLILDLHMSKPKMEVLTDLLGKLLQFRKSDLAKLSLIDQEEEITDVINDVINKIKNELITY